MINKRLQLIAKHILKKYATKSISTFPYRCLSTVSRTHSALFEASQSYINYMGKDPLVYRNVGQELERAAAEYSSTEAIVSCHEVQRYTFKSLLEEVDRLAAGFRKLDLKKGDYISIWGPNNMHWYLTMLAASRAGLVSVGINPAFQGPELEYCLKKVNVKAVVCPLTYKSQNYYEILHSICPELSSSKKGKINSKNLPHLKAVIINTDSKLEGAFTFNEVLDLCDKQECNEIYKLQPYIVPDTPCNVQFTSGTTGHPKAAVLSHFNFVNNGIHIGNRNQLKGNRICVQVPLFHAYGVVISIMAGMSHGATLVLPAPGFSPEHSLKTVVDEKCTVIHGTPTMYVDLIKKQRELNLPLTTLKMAVTGGAPCSPQLFLDIKNVLNLQEVRTIFGLTETSASIFQSRPGDTTEQVLNTVGHVQDNIEVKVVDTDGNIVPFGQPGELLVRGYLNMLGYHGDEEKTKETIGADKWLRTGDQFILQPDGYGRIVGRLKEMIIRGGENIFPKEIEDFLNSHNDILETHVIGVPDERMGEEISAFVRMHEKSATIDRDAIKQYCKGKLAHFKVPRYVITVDDFPKTTSGKIQKFKLTEQFHKTYGKNLSTVSRTHSALFEASQSYINYMGKDPLVYRSVGQELERAAAEYSSTEAIVSCHEVQRYTFKSLLEEVDRLAAGFRKLDLKKGDYISIWGPNNMHWYLTMLAASRAGLVSVGINPAFQGPELEYCLKKVNVKAVVCPLTYKSQNYYEILHSICPELSSSKKGKINSKNLPHLKAVIINTDSKLEGAFTFNEVLDLCDKQECNEIYKLQPYIVPDTPCNVQFTSGTTGHPKAAVLSHFNFVNNGIHIGNRNQLKGNRICVQVPLFHAYGVVISIMAGMSHGATLVLPAPGFSPEHSLKTVVDEKCTVIHGTPTMYVDLIKKQRELNLPLTTLKMAVTGGAPCSPQLFLDIKNVLNLQEVRTIFGLTETSASIFQSRPGDTTEQVLNTVGHVQDNIEVKVVDTDGNIVPFGQPGELLVRGYLNMLGYHGDEEKTKETIGADKWLRTGDQFILQPDGYGRIVGRLKEMIIRGGENIFPKEIEDFLNSHNDILETHVIGVPDERMGEEISAFVRMHEKSATIDRDAIKQYCKGKLAHFKVPRYVITVDDFPKTTSGKIQKFKLTEQFHKTYGKK